MRVLDGDGLLRALRVHEQVSNVLRVVSSQDQTLLVSVHESAVLITALRSFEVIATCSFDVLLDLPSKRFPKVDRSLGFAVLEVPRGLRLKFSNEEPELTFVTAPFDVYEVLHRMDVSTLVAKFALSASELLRVLSTLVGAASVFSVLGSGGRLRFAAHGPQLTCTLRFASLEPRADILGEFAHEYDLLQLRVVAKDLLAQTECVEGSVDSKGLLRIRGARDGIHWVQVCCLLPQQDAQQDQEEARP